MVDYIRDQIKEKRAVGYYPKILRKRRVFCPKRNSKIYETSCSSEHNTCKYKQTNTCVIRRSLMCKLLKYFDAFDKEFKFEYVKIAHCINNCDKFDSDILMCSLNSRYEKLHWDFNIQNDCKYRSIDICNWNSPKSIKCYYKSCPRRTKAQMKHEANMEKGERVS